MLFHNLEGPGAVAPTYTTDQQFEAQAWSVDHAAGVGYTFLAGGAPNIVPRADPGLRVSANGLFAVANGVRVIADTVDVNRALWGFHWAGVVALDGTDYLTLENYSRIGENAVGQGAGLFCFQMYGAGPGQSWHEAWETPHALSKAFANAITVPVQVSGEAGLRYFTAGSKNHHADVTAAADDLELQRALCYGLNYANVHLYADRTVDEFADRARRTSWLDAVDAVLLAPPAWSTPTTRAFAQYVRDALHDVRTLPL